MKWNHMELLFFLVEFRPHILDLFKQQNRHGSLDAGWVGMRLGRVGGARWIPWPRKQGGQLLCRAGGQFFKSWATVKPSPLPHLHQPLCVEVLIGTLRWVWVSLAGVSNLWSSGCMLPRMAVNVARHKIVNLLKTWWDFFVCDYALQCI